MSGEHRVLGAVEWMSREKSPFWVGGGDDENAASAIELLVDLGERGVDPNRHYLFVIDGFKALRAAVNRVFGAGSSVQRCRHHKIKNVSCRVTWQSRCSRS